MGVPYAHIIGSAPSSGHVLLCHPNSHINFKSITASANYNVSGREILTSHARIQDFLLGGRTTHFSAKIYVKTAPWICHCKSLCNHHLSIMHSCQCHRLRHQHHWHPCTALLATGFKIEKFIFGMNMHIYPQYMHIKYLVILACSF